MDFWSIIFEYCETNSLSVASRICKSSYRIFIKLPFTFWKKRLEHEFPEHHDYELLKKNLDLTKSKGYEFYKLIYKDLIVNGAYYTQWNELPFIRCNKVNSLTENIDNWKKNIKGYYQLSDNPTSNNMIIISSLTKLNDSSYSLRNCDQELLLIPNKKFHKADKKLCQKQLRVWTLGADSLILTNKQSNSFELIDKYYTYVIQKNLMLDDYFDLITKCSKFIEQYFPIYDAMLLAYDNHYFNTYNNFTIKLIGAQIKYKLSRKTNVTNSIIHEHNKSENNTCGYTGGKSSKTVYCSNLGHFELEYSHSYFGRCHLHPRNPSEIILEDPSIDWIHLDPKQLAEGDIFNIDWHFDNSQKHVKLIIRTSDELSYKNVLFVMDAYKCQKYLPFTHIEINGESIDLSQLKL